MNTDNLKKIVLKEVYSAYDKMLREKHSYFVNEGMNFGEISTAEPISGKIALTIANEVASNIKKTVEGVENVKVGNRLGDMAAANKDVDRIVLFVEMEYDDSVGSGADMKEIQALADFIRSNYGEVEMHTGNGKDKTRINFPYEYQEEGHTKHAEVVLQVTADSEWTKTLSNDSMNSEFDNTVKKMLLVKIAEVTPYQGEDAENYKNDEMYDGEWADTPRSKWSYEFGDDALYWRNRARAGKKKPGERNSELLGKSFPRFDGNVPGSKKRVTTIKNVFGKDVEKSMKLSQVLKMLLGEDATMNTISSVENIVKFLNSDKYKFAGNEEMLTEIKEGVMFSLERDGKIDEAKAFEEMWNRYSMGEQVNEMKSIFGRMMLY